MGPTSTRTGATGGDGRPSTSVTATSMVAARRHLIRTTGRPTGTSMDRRALEVVAGHRMCRSRSPPSGTAQIRPYVKGPDRMWDHGAGP